MPCFLNFSNNLPCGTLSNAFAKSKKDYIGCSLVTTPTYHKGCRDCAIDNAYSSVIMIMGFASVIQCNIVSVKPMVNGLLDRHIPILNTMFKPRPGKGDEICIMWTQVGDRAGLYHIGHNHIGHTKRPYWPKRITISATKIVLLFYRQHLSV